VAELNTLDAQLEAACESNDEAAFTVALDSLLSRVRALGRRSRTPRSSRPS